MADDKAKVTDNTHEMNFSDLFTRPNAVTIPLFQREYVWTEKQWARMRREIELIADGQDNSRFLGALIAIKRDSGNPATPDQFEIVDGQQRLTTLFLFILAAAFVAAKNKQNDLASGIINQMLIINWSREGVNTKLIPSFSDRAQFNGVFNQVITLGNLSSQFVPIVNLPQSSGKQAGRLSKQFSRIKAYLTKVYKDQGLERFQLLIESARNRMTFVYILLKDASNATTVFEGLNDPGIPIGIGDLIRNEVFSKVSESPQEALNVHQNLWVPFHDKLGDDFDKYFFPYGIIQSSSVTRADLFHLLREGWGDIENPAEIIQRLEEYADEFLLLAGSSLDSSRPRALSNAVRDLRDANLPSSTFPFLMKLLKEQQLGNVSLQDAVDCCRVIESFLARRAIVGLEPTGLLVFFRTLWSSLKREYTGTNLKKSLERRTTIEWPNDNRVQAAIRERAIYQVTIKNYLLAEYDRSLGGDIPSDVPWVEHVMPQNLSKEWKDSMSNEEVERHKILKHSWGNLVPLSSSMNQKISNGEYEKKRSELGDKSMYMSARKLAEDYPDWNIDSIVDRSSKIADWAVTRWPNFDS